MASYRIELSDQAVRVIQRMAKREPEICKRVTQALDYLERNPFEGKPLKGGLKGRHSYRVGSYRVIYLVRRRELLVLMIDIGHRRDIYR